MHLLQQFAQSPFGPRLYDATAPLFPSPPVLSNVPDKAEFVARDLACRRGGRQVFAGIGFSLAPGDALVLTGPNGSGKSSLLRILAGLLPPADGALTWAGRSVAEEPEAHHARAAYLGHLDAVKPALGVAENLAFWIALGGGDTGQAVPALARFGLETLADLPARYLSQGQRRRLALARVAALPRALWLLDEPSVGLDADSLSALCAAIEAHRAAGGMVVLSTHAPLAIAAPRQLDLRS
jgi:heme exporter protein A